METALLVALGLMVGLAIAGLAVFVTRQRTPEADPVAAQLRPICRAGNRLSRPGNGIRRGRASIGRRGPLSWGQKLFVFGRALAALGEVFVIFVNQFAAAVLLALGTHEAALGLTLFRRL